MGAPNLYFTISSRKLSSVPGNDFITVTFKSDIEYKSFECRATKSNEDYGIGKGELIATFSETPAETERRFEIYNTKLLKGDGEYRISLFATGYDGNVNDNFIFIPQNSNGLITSGNKMFLCRR